MEAPRRGKEQRSMGGTHKQVQYETRWQPLGTKELHKSRSESEQCNQGGHILGLGVEGVDCTTLVKGRRTKQRNKKVLVDEIRTFLRSICVKLKQNKNWKHLLELVFFQNINEGGWWWCHTESSSKSLLFLNPPFLDLSSEGGNSACCVIVTGRIRWAHVW